MARTHTIKKARTGLRVVTLSAQMVEKMKQSPIEAVQLTLELTFQAVSELTGDRVILCPEQEDELAALLKQSSSINDPDSYLAWRWLKQGARASDTRDMDQLLRVATRAVESLADLQTDGPTVSRGALGEVNRIDSNASESIPSPAFLPRSAR